MSVRSCDLGILRSMLSVVSTDGELEPVTGFEPATRCLQITGKGISGGYLNLNGRPRKALKAMEV
jgi:hypothetical protein